MVEGSWQFENMTVRVELEGDKKVPKAGNWITTDSKGLTQQLDFGPGPTRVHLTDYRDQLLSLIIVKQLTLGILMTQVQLKFM